MGGGLLGYYCYDYSRVDSVPISTPIEQRKLTHSRLMVLGGTSWLYRQIETAVFKKRMLQQEKEEAEEEEGGGGGGGSDWPLPTVLKGCEQENNVVVVGFINRRAYIKLYIELLNKSIMEGYK